MSRLLLIVCVRFRLRGIFTVIYLNSGMSRFLLLRDAKDGGYDCHHEGFVEIYCTFILFSQWNSSLSSYKENGENAQQMRSNYTKLKHFRQRKLNNKKTIVCFLWEVLLFYPYGVSDLFGFGPLFVFINWNQVEDFSMKLSNQAKPIKFQPTVWIMLGKSGHPNKQQFCQSQSQLYRESQTSSCGHLQWTGVLRSAAREYLK